MTALRLQECADYMSRIAPALDEFGRVDPAKITLEILTSQRPLLPKGVDPLEIVAGVFYGMVDTRQSIQKDESRVALTRLVTENPEIAQLAIEQWMLDAVLFAKWVETPDPIQVQSCHDKADMVRSILARLHCNALLAKMPEEP